MQRYWLVLIFLILKLLLEIDERIFLLGLVRNACCPDIFVVEITTVFETLKFTIEAGFRGELVFKCDNLAIVNVLISKDKDLAVGVIIIEDIYTYRKSLNR